MKNSKSPFKRFSHSREGSTDEHNSFFHKHSVSGSSTHMNDVNHSRNASASGVPPVSGMKASHKRNTSTSSRASQNSNFLAEQYERDRKAIIDCCFSAHDNKSKGFTSSYITHVRIIEDSKSPSSRPPLNSKLENKKKRVLILSCKTGNYNEIQLHKGRESSEGTFQIGRTWDLKELTKVERDTEINEGFILTMGKKYYWETNSAKERTVFLKSLINSFMQAFDGHVPELINWDLSSFYLDEKSYQRAVIRSSHSMSRTAAATSMTTSTTPSTATNESQYMRQNKSPQKDHRKGPSVDQEGPTSKQSAMSLNKSPYSNSPTIIEVNKRFNNSRISKETPESPSKDFDNFVQKVDATAIPVPSVVTPSASSTATSFSSKTSQAPDQYVRKITSLNKGNVDSDKSSRKDYNDSEESHSSLTKNNYNLLENLNNVLSSNDVLLETAAKVPQDSFINAKESNADQNMQYSVAKVESLEVYADGETASAFDVDEDLNATIPEDTMNDNSAKSREKIYHNRHENTYEEAHEDTYEDANEDTNEDTYEDTYEDTNELSFEKGDEIRYSRALDSESSHIYHEVSTIQEEASGRFTEKEVQDRSQKSSPEYSDVKQLPKKSWDIDDEEMLEILTDINWDVDDDAEKLIEKLDIKMAEAEYSFNKGLLSLEKLGPSLVPFEENVDKECNKMNPILSLFLMEMGNVADDIEYVESQKNGLQVESANKKQLWDTLTELMNTVSLDDETLSQLLNCPVSEKNLNKMEAQLVVLFKALKAISGERDENGYNLGEMRALKQRRETYEKVTKIFLERLVNEMEGKFKNISFGELSEDHLMSFLTRLLGYSSLTLFCKDISPSSYNDLIEKWNASISLVYKKMANSIIQNLKKSNYSLSAAEHHVTANQPGWRELLMNNDRKEQAEECDVPNQEIILQLSEPIETLGKWCIFYQNFIDTFFHISSKLDFEQYIHQFNDPRLRITSLEGVKTLQSDRGSASREFQLVSRIFQPIMTQMSSYVIDVSKSDKSLAPALMVFLEQKMKNLESSNAEFLNAVLSRLFVQVKQLWLEHIDEEVVYIQRININFSSRIIFPVVLGFTLLINNSKELIGYFQKRLKIQKDAPFEAIQCFDEACRKLGSAIAALMEEKSNTKNTVITSTPMTTSNTSNLDRTITLLMNSDWLFEILNNLNAKGLFDSTIQAAKKMFDKEKDAYAVHLIEAAMPKLTSFVNGAMNLVGNASGAQAADPSHWAAYSKNNLDNILASYSSKEIQVLVERLHDHMESHFANEPSDSTREAICDKLWSCLQGHTVSVYLKLYTLIERHYKGTYVKFTKNDIITAFESFKRVRPVKYNT